MLTAAITTTWTRERSPCEENLIPLIDQLINEPVQVNAENGLLWIHPVVVMISIATVYRLLSHRKF